ncbi:MAG TPA: glycosyltransferase family 4 protein [Thermoanaerobaculia bacterium]|nr:glycosyltransferase family 4 protein [Thermoanaerobaculia bacterium]
MRLLLVSHPPLAPESGAAQLTMSLAEALAARGHDALAWSPEPLPPGTRWWNRWVRQRRALERHVEAVGPFDVIDAPAVSVSPRLARAAPVVARSFQPEISYLVEDLRTQLRRRPLPSPRLPFHAVHGAVVRSALVRGWERSRAILCLGTLELDGMRSRYPRWAARLRSYVVAPSPADQEALARVRRERRPARPEVGLRFLWIGRWASHKGTDRLVRFLEKRAAACPGDTFTLAGCGEAAERDCPPGLLAEGRLRLIPSFRREELPALLAAHDAGLFTSTVEGWGLSLNEMLESGLPVFATRAGGVPDLLPFFPGSLLPFPPEPGARPELPDPETRGYFERFTWDRIAEAYEREVLEALG